MKKLIAFLILAVGLAGYIYFFDNSKLDSNQQTEEQNQLLYDTFQEKHVHHIIIKNGKETIEMTRPWLGEWTLNNLNYPADREVINAMLDVVLGLTKDQLISNNPENWDKFEVTPEKGIEVILKEREDREIAHFWVGKTGPSYGTQYFRKNNLDEVYLVNADLKAQFTRPLDAWRDHTILELDTNKFVPNS